MRKYFVLEVNYANGIVYTHEVSEPELGVDAVYHYTRAAGSDCLIATEVGARFYGKLDALLVTRKKVADAEPIEPEVSLA